MTANSREILHEDFSMNPMWLKNVLIRNKDSLYLKKYGSPLDMATYRANVPLTGYDDLELWLRMIINGASDVLFKGNPIAYERTSGSLSGPKLIPYTEEGLDDFQKNIAPWLLKTFEKYRISKKIYFSISPVTRKPEIINGVHVGLPDGAYLGPQLAEMLSLMSAVPSKVGCIGDVGLWKAATLEYLKNSGRELEMISVWSPTFLLDLLANENHQELFPNLRLISCWTSAAALPYADKLKAIFPQAHIQSKGLVSTECVVTVPDGEENLVLAEHGFYEFRMDHQIILENELIGGHTYEVVITTASGLYRYRTGDYVLFTGRNSEGRPILSFTGRGNVVCDLVGEKLTEPFVAQCLKNIDGFRLLIPDQFNRCYRLIIEGEERLPSIDVIESKLNENPQYQYARKIGQLNNIKVVVVKDAKRRYIDYILENGSRLGDVKPVALRNEMHWINVFGEAIK